MYENSNEASYETSKCQKFSSYSFSVHFNKKISECILREDEKDFYRNVLKNCWQTAILGILRSFNSLQTDFSDIP